MHEPTCPQSWGSLFEPCTCGAQTEIVVDPQCHDDLKEMLREIGFCPAPPLFAVGTPVVEYGQDRFRTMRDDGPVLNGEKRVFWTHAIIWKEKTDADTQE